MVVQRRRHPGALQRRRRSLPESAESESGAVDVLGQRGAVRAARGAAAAGLPARRRASRRFRERPLPRVVGPLPGADHRPHALRHPRRPQASLALRRAEGRRTGPRAGRRALGRGARGRAAPRERPRALHGAGPRDAYGRAALPVPRGLGLARADVEGGDGARRGGGAEHLQVLPAHPGRLQGAQVR